MYTAKRSRRRTLAIVGGVVIVLAVFAAIVVSAMGGSGGKPARAASTSAPAAPRARRGHHARAASTGALAAPASETSVIVLNGTETTGLAHRTASELQQGGYSLASAQSGRPPGSGQVSLIEYSGGHKPEAEAVARSLAIRHVLPIEAGVSALAGSASVVVIVGADRAGQAQ